jgi:hypothetical protein
MERVELKVWAILILSLVSLPLSRFLMEEGFGTPFLLVSAIWLVSPAFFVNDRPLFNLCLAHSLFYVVQYVSGLSFSLLETVDTSRRAISTPRRCFA